MSDKFLAIRTAVINALIAEFPRLRTVKPHGGSVNLDEILRFTMRTPAARVAWVGTTVSRDRVQRASGASTFAVFIVCKDRRNDPAPDQAMRWAEAITTLIDGNTFDLGFASSAKVLSTENNYKTDQDITGTALAQVRFEMDLTLEDGDNGEGQGEFPDDQRPIEIYQSVLASPNLGSFEPVQTLALIHSATATVKTLGGLSEMNQVALTTANATHELTIPYTATAIDITCVVKFGGKKYEIKEVENVNEANKYLVLRCAAKGDENKGAV